MVACKSELHEQIQTLKELLCQPESTLEKEDVEKMKKERFLQVFGDLFSLSSVRLINTVEKSEYNLDSTERYFPEDLT